MSTVFKDFLQGLLTKNPRQRLAWPQLLEHPFVAHGVKGKCNILYLQICFLSHWILALMLCELQTS